ncbi:hypothetical protein RC1_2717 [Rhodospirillum centenum SW]|uniref:Uncharacterized protein n=1 Tax=Rhodospirillum centenum (strain ATCC 51521 / SW) TaxID=414684 RepID=B6IUB2_RHOCS|nr:hypothetical protein RC1_2717 [Rhodospirillum centenum SW]
MIGPFPGVGLPDRNGPDVLRVPSGPADPQLATITCQKS